MNPRVPHQILCYSPLLICRSCYRRSEETFVARDQITVHGAAEYEGPDPLGRSMFHSGAAFRF
jgi:hypothetical protein